MSNFTDFISSGGGGTLYTIPITKSTTWTPPYNGTAVIHCIGAGGGGAGDEGEGYCTAGAAGGYSRKSVTLSTGTNWTMVVGAGGAGANNSANGNAGGNTTATDSSSSLTANGGAAGLTSSTSAPSGGSASGGDINNTGGAGGSNGNMCTGGAVGVLGTGMAGSGATSVESAAYGYGGHSDVQSPQFENTNGELRGGGRGGKTQYGNSLSSIVNSDGGFLAGGGAAWGVSSSRPAFAGDGGIGGGGGTSNGAGNSSIPITNAGSGGKGLIIVMYTAIG